MTRGSVALLSGIRRDFGAFDGRVWLNCSHQGPLPLPAVEAAQAAIALKVSPARLNTSEPFQRVPERLRTALGRLIGAKPEDVILGNSASYGINLLAQGLPLQAGDEVLLAAGDFPATVFPWLVLEDRGVVVRQIRTSGPVLAVDDLRREIGPHTRVVCASWVHSFNGHALDEVAVGSACRSAGVLFVLNGSQGVGARPLAVDALPVDAVTGCGHKYLCGPYGTGYCWIRPDLRESLRSTQAYWLSNMTADDLKSGGERGLRRNLGVRRFDVMGTANFLNFMTWTASIEYVLGIGVDRIAEHDQLLVQRVLDGLSSSDLSLVSPRAGASRTTLVLVESERAERTAELFERLRTGGVDVALRKGRLRISPHFYNGVEDVDRAIELLKSS
jgi:selenocysteine lyase/cysteine desulfurase